MLFGLRNAESASQGENNWGFGQIVPCAMFLAPVLALLDTAARTMKDDHELQDPHIPPGKGPRSLRFKPLLTPVVQVSRSSITT
jgi:hypothetical protein